MILKWNTADEIRTFTDHKVKIMMLPLLSYLMLLDWSYSRISAQNSEYKTGYSVTKVRYKLKISTGLILEDQYLSL